MISINSGKNIIFIFAIIGLIINVANLMVIGIPGNPFALLIIGIAILAISSKSIVAMGPMEMRYILLWAGILFLFGIFVVIPGKGLSLDHGAVLAAMVLLASYIVAKFVIIHSLAFWFSTLGYLLVLLPSLFNIAAGTFRLREVFAYSSENFLTSWLLITALSMVTASLIEQRKVPIWPIAFTFVISMIQATRASIVVSLLALIAVLYIRLGPKLAFSIAFAILITSIPLGNEIGKAIESAIDSSKFGRSGLASPRWLMWANYLNFQNFGTVVFGTSTDIVPLIDRFNGNPHNSFIRFHAYFGIIPLLLMLLTLGRGVTRAGFALAAPLALVAIRSFSDILIFGTILDIYLMILLIPTLGIPGKSRYATGREHSGYNRLNYSELRAPRS